MNTNPGIHKPSTEDIVEIKDNIDVTVDLELGKNQFPAMVANIMYLTL